MRCDFSSQRRFWKSAGLTAKNFGPKLKSNSRHNRKSGNALAHEHGSASLQGSIHDVLNHSSSTNSRYYKTMSRQRSVRKGKQELFLLRQKQAVGKLQVSSSRTKRAKKSSKPLHAYKSTVNSVRKGNKPVKRLTSVGLEGVAKELPRARRRQTPVYLQDFVR